MSMSSVLSEQPVLLMVHRNTYVPAALKPLTPVSGSLASAIEADKGPLICDQFPVPAPGVFAAITVVPGDTHTVWSTPASAVVGAAPTLMVTLLWLLVQGLLLIVQRNT